MITIRHKVSAFTMQQQSYDFLRNKTSVAAYAYQVASNDHTIRKQIEIIARDQQTCGRAPPSCAHAARTGAREASCADFGVGFWCFNPKPE
jgi:hypothetical protein